MEEDVALGNFLLLGVLPPFDGSKQELAQIADQYSGHGSGLMVSRKGDFPLA